MSIIRFKEVTKRYDSCLVLRNTSFRLDAGDRLGLIGQNGAGKTTILKLILGQEAPTEGTVELASSLKLGYFSQFSELNSEFLLQDIMESVFSSVKLVEDELNDVGASMASASEEGDDFADLLIRQAHLLEAMEKLDGWSYHTQIEIALSKLGFNDEDRSKPVGQLSGGWRNRACLAKILLEKPDVLLLDEPTNYLDISGVSWLETWLKAYRGACIVVSHDRRFLDQVVTRIIEVENHGLQEYAGGFTAYVRERKTRLKSIERRFQHEEELLVYESEAIEDRKEALRNPSHALMRKLADIKKRIEPRPVDRIITGIYERLRVGNKICRMESLSKGYSGRTLFTHVSVEICKGDRLAIVGPNGCGKTTLLRILTDVESPDDGRVAWYGGFSWFNQVLDELDLDDTVTHSVNPLGLAYSAPRSKVNQFLSLMQFSEMDLKKTIGTLSGGQRARVALAICLLSGCSAIVLDEPTNHLDMVSIQVMERALVSFPGAVIVVSHDRFFLDKVANKMLVFGKEGSCEMFNGNWTLWELSHDVASTCSSET